MRSHRKREQTCQTSYDVRLINACSEGGAGFFNLVIGVRNGLEPAPT